MLPLLELAFDPFLRIGELVVRWQALLVALGVLAALLVAAVSARSERTRGPGRSSLRLDDLLYLTLGILPGAIIGARLVHALGYLEVYAAQPGLLLDTSRGGFSLLGVVVGGTLTGGYVASLLDGSARRWAAVAAPSTLIALGIGKVGQFLGGGGQGVFWDGPWAVAFSGPGPWLSAGASVPAHPVALYEALWSFAGIPIVLWLRRRAVPVPGGRPFLAAVAWFLVGRLLLGALWRDDRIIGPLNVEQALAGLALTVVAAAAVAAMIRQGEHQGRRRRWPLRGSADVVAGPMVLEIRTYRISGGQRDDFDRRFGEGAGPMLERYGIDVVGAGPSIEDEEHYVLLRAFASLEQRNQLEDAFYGSDEWRNVHRPGIMALIDAYHTVVLETTPEAVEGLRRSLAERR